MAGAAIRLFFWFAFAFVSATGDTVPAAINAGLLLLAYALMESGLRDAKSQERR